ncbi:MAG: dockerin type I repeat-containing protein [Ruminococcus sp.]|nr:dockerin type I repeat-containing protein [Ruminococcus sp.]
MTKIKKTFCAILSAVFAAVIAVPAPSTALAAENSFCAEYGSPVSESDTADSGEINCGGAYKNSEISEAEINQTKEEEAVGAYKTNLWNCTVKYPDSMVYTGSEVVPKNLAVECRDKILTEGEDFTIEYSDNINAGTAKMTITGIGSYTGTAEFDYTISKKSVSALTIALKNNTFIYDGKAHYAGVTVKLGKTLLTEGEDYILSYSDNVKIGTATVTITGIGNFTGKVNRAFTIGRTKLFSDCTFTLGATKYDYSGSAKKPAVTVKDGSKTLTSGVDYLLTYSDNTDAGTATVTLKGRGIYSGTVYKTFSILPKKLDSSAVMLESSRLEHDGENKIAVSVYDGSKPLTSGTDYTVSYSNNRFVGSTAWAEVEFKGNYSGKITKAYRIVEKPISRCSISFNTKIAELGRESDIKPSITNGNLTLEEGRDYKVEYNAGNVGLGYIYIQGLGNYSEVYRAIINIAPIDINKADISVSTASNYLYDNGVVGKLVSVKYEGEKLNINKDYTVALEHRDNGTACYTVKGKGRFGGEYQGEYKESADYESYAKNCFVWGRDNWSFDNSSFNFVNSYSVNSAVKKSLMKDFSMNDSDKAAVNTNILNEEAFRGSCFGMSVSSILVKLGAIDIKKYSGCDSLCEIEPYNNGTDICNFVQSSYMGTRFAELTREASKCGEDLSKLKKSSFSQSEYIKKLEAELKQNDTVVSLIFRIEHSGGNSMSHAVVAYGIEDYDYSHTFADGMTKSYDKRILVYDPNHGQLNTVYDKSCFYYNSADGSWICPEWTPEKGNTFCYWNSESGKSVSTGSLSSIVKYYSLTCTCDLMTGAIYDYLTTEKSEGKVGKNETLTDETDKNEIKWVQKEDIPDYKLKSTNPGDANLDSKVDINDATLIQNYLADLAELSEIQLLAADANQDGEVKIDDAVAIQFKIAELV